MEREYLNYVGDALNNGMTKEEVNYLFNDIYEKSNTRQGKRVLRLFARGIGKAKKNVFKKTNVSTTDYPQMTQDNQVKGYQYQYFKQ